MLLLTISMVLRICLELYLKDIALFVLILLIYIIKFKREYFFFLIVCIVMFGITFYGEYKYNNSFKNVDECSGLCKILSFTEEKENSNKYIVRFKNKKLILYTDKNIILEYGDIVYFEGNFQNAASQRNQNGFDYQRYLRQSKIYGILRTEKIKIIKKEKNIFYYIFSLKNNLKIRLNEVFDRDKSGFLVGLLLGDKSLLNEEIEINFKNSNLSHILAISGMHVTYVLFGLEFCISKFIRSRKIKNFVLIFLLIFFAIFTGSSPSCIRAVIMSCLVLLSNNLYRKNDFFTSLLLSLNILLLINYYNIESVGMWLSYMGTLGLVCSKRLFNFGKNTNNFFIENIKNSFSVQIMIFPIMLYSYNTISLTFFISNFFSSILIGPIIILGYIILFLGKFSRVLIFIEEFLIELLLKIAEIVGNLRLSKIYVITPNKVFFILYYLVILIWYFKNDEIIKEMINKACKFVKKYIKIIIFIVVLIIIAPNINRSLKINFLDVGQGDCTVIVTEQNKVILVDAGNNEGYDYGENVVMPYLLKKGINKLDYMIVSHFDSDHCGGMFFILKNMKVKNIVIGWQTDEYENYKEFIKLAEEKQVNIIILKQGDVLKFDNKTYIKVLFPDTSKIIEENKINNNSLVFKLMYNKFSMLFTGDIEECAEKALLEKYKQNLQCDILKVAHHGSKTSSSQYFIKQVKPKVALIGVGLNNTFGHPNLEVIQRLNTCCANIYRTDINGEINIIVDYNGKFNIKVKYK